MNINIENYHLKSRALFEYLTKEEVAFIKSNLVNIEYVKGSLIFSENSYSRGVYIVKKGKVKIFQTNSDGKNNIVYIYKKEVNFGTRL